MLRLERCISAIGVTLYSLELKIKESDARELYKKINSKEDFGNSAKELGYEIFNLK